MADQPPQGNGVPRPLPEDAQAKSPGAMKGPGEGATMATPPPLFTQRVIEPAEFPRGFWRQFDYLLRHPEEIMESLRRDLDLVRISRIFFMLALIMSAAYGAVMGATNLLQGSAMPLGDKFILIAISAIKVPVLFLLTLGIVLPPIYVSNAFVGAHHSFRQIMSMLLGATALTATILASMATVALFFSLTSRSYDFIKLLHVVFFAYAGVMGLGFLERADEATARGTFRKSSRKLRWIWLLLYMFVGTQLAWVMRPYVGSPEEPLTVFRAREGNFYESVFKSLGEVLED